MTSAQEVLRRAGELTGQNHGFVLATVVNVTRPASTRRGDKGLVTESGELVGWVGGACSEPIVIREALRALADGEPRLVRIGPPGSHEDTPDDVVAAESMCASEGTVEVLLEPQLPARLLAVVGDGPAARVLAELAGTIGWRVATELRGDADAVVVATMGHGDEDVLTAALEAPIGYVGLIASARRAAAVLAELRGRGVEEESLARVRSPAGLDLGPSTQPEIAVAVLAELVAWRHTHGEVPTPPAEAIDPVCGMTVAIEGARETAVHDGVTYYFCGGHCRKRFEADPASFVGVETQ
jgi:xanthine dehydrogenase accessory factor